ncbi:MAG: hypothetical protein CMO81_02550 [Waddliaceae bacterium]|nr:hypothetical protein [Waddliaceae bacterium]
MTEAVGSGGSNPINVSNPDNPNSVEGQIRTTSGLERDSIQEAQRNDTDSGTIVGAAAPTLPTPGWSMAAYFEVVYGNNEPDGSELVNEIDQEGANLFVAMQALLMAAIVMIFITSFSENVESEAQASSEDAESDDIVSASANSNSSAQIIDENQSMTAAVSAYGTIVSDPNGQRG